MNNSGVACWLAIACGMLGGCKSPSAEPTPAASGNTAASTSGEPPAMAPRTAPAAARPSIPQGDITAPFTIHAAPTAKDVPNAPLAGSANGHAFVVKRVEISASVSEWWLTLIGPSRSPTVRWDHDSEYAQVRFGYVEDGPRPYTSSALARRVFRKQLGAEDSGISLSFNIVNPAAPESTQKHTGDGALYLEFTSWNVKPWRNDQKHQVAGVASGKIYLGLAGNGSIAASGVVGEFKDVPVSRTLLQP